MRKPKLSTSVLFLCLFAALQGSAAAQAPAQAPAAQAPVTAPAPAETPAPVTEAETAPAIPPPCFPACRDGYTCGADGQCVSACNPGCGAGERCTGQGQCVLDAQVTPTAPPTYPPPPPPAAHEPPPFERGVETHDGVMLRFTVGIGGGVMTDTLDESVGGFYDELTFAGGGFMGSIDLGAALTDELTLHGRLGLLNVFSPRIEGDGEEIELEIPNGGGAAADSDSISMNAMLLGPGITYNFMPINLYVTAVGGLSVLAISTNDEDVDQDEFDRPEVGFGLNLDVGKEWWVTEQTGIGVAGRFWWATGGAENELTARTVDSSRDLIAFGILFSVTHQ